MSLPIKCEETETPFIISQLFYFVSTIMLLTIFAVTVSLLPIERRLAMRGKLLEMPANTPVFITSNAYVIHWLVKEGQQVKKNQRLLQYQPMKSLSDDGLLTHDQSKKLYKNLGSDIQLLIHEMKNLDLSFHPEIYRRIDELMTEMLRVKNQDYMLQRSYLRSPIDGVISKIRSMDGDYISMVDAVAEVGPVNKHHYFESIIPDFYYRQMNKLIHKMISVRIFSRHCHPCQVQSQIVKIEKPISEQTNENKSGHYILLTWPNNLQQEEFTFELILGYTTLWECIWYSNDDYR